MSFLSKLEEGHLNHIIDEHIFQPIVPMNGGKFADIVEHIVKDKLKVYIDYDCDPDGYFSALCLVEIFKLLGFSDYVLARHQHKRHVLADAYVAALARESYDIIFILDSSTNAMTSISTLVDTGKTVCVVDHHICNYKFSDYPDNAIVINPLIDKSLADVGYANLSCGAVMSLLCAFTLQTKFNIKPPTDLYLYGVITLYSDIMNLNNDYNIAFISRFRNTQFINSKLVKLFWDQYSHFDRSYISFKLIPRLNALFRTENFSLLYKVFFESDSVDYDAVRQQIDMHYLECKKYVERLLSDCSILEYDKFVVAKIKGSRESYAKNFTGLVASNLSSTYNKAILCLCEESPVMWTGSVRDPFSRDLHALMKPLCYAEGHASAFGVRIDARDLDMLIVSMCEAMSELDDISDNVILVDWDNRSEGLSAEIQQMAEYNEYGGQGLPLAMGAVTVKPSYKIYRSERKISVYGEGQKYICCVPTVEVGDTLLVKPTLSGASYTNFVNNVHLKRS